jgi:uncharacterized membrane protein
MSILVVVATFLAAGVEWVEALTIVLAVGTYRNWRSALAGTGAAIVALLVMVAVFGAALSSYVPITIARTAVGVFLLLFGLKWLHKAILRSAGLVPLHDEEKAFRETRDELGGWDAARRGLDWKGAFTSFNGVLLEGLEVVFIVIALGGLNSVAAAATGALVSAVIVIAVGIGLHRPLTRVPENHMKYVVGIMLTSFGTFFVGEGIGVDWWRADLSLLPLIAVYAVASLAMVAWLRREPADAVDSPIVRALRAVVQEIWGLFVNDGALALGTLATILGVALLVTRRPSLSLAAGAILTVGVVGSVLIGVSGPAGRRRRTAPADADGEAGELDEAPVVASV